ncbi:MAG: ankyrin repeat domain-containing protein [Desulfobulbaceae bacterium]|nr:ankyrin repeat domain-containing protein [Desulfobulbaceae bacterium]
MQKQELVDAILNSKTDTAMNLLQLGVNPDTKDPESGLTLVMIAAGLGNKDMVKLLLDSGADVNVLDDKYGYTALHKAAMCGSIEIAAMLLDKGAFLDVQSPSNGHTPLYDAMWYKNVAMTKFLLDKGANLHLITRYDFDIDKFLDFALEVNKEEKRDILEIQAAVRARQKMEETTIQEQQLMQAVRQGDLESVKKLIGDGAEVDGRYPVINSFDDGYTPLLVASRDNYPEIVRELLKAGADPRAQDTIFHGEPIHKAGYIGNPEVARILVGADNVDINVRGDMNGYTPLHDALWHSNTETARVLLEAGARVDIKGHDGLNCLDIALKVYPSDHKIVHTIRQRLEGIS